MLMANQLRCGVNIIQREESSRDSAAKASRRARDELELEAKKMDLNGTDGESELKHFSSKWSLQDLRCSNAILRLQNPLPKKETKAKKPINCNHQNVKLQCSYEKGTELP